MVRVGEMMVVIRAQDFASRTLHKVSGELAGMSRAQAMARRQMMMTSRQMEMSQRIGSTKGHLQNLRLIEQNIAATEKLKKVEANRLRAQRFVDTPPTRRYKNPYRRDAERAVRRLGNEQAVLTKQLARYQSQINAMPSMYGRMNQAALMSAAGQAQLNAAMQKGIYEARQLAIQEKLLIEEQMLLNRQMALMPLQRLHSIGAAMSGIGRTMQLFGAVGLGVLGLMANSFAKFSSSATTAATQMRDFGGSVQQIQSRSKLLQSTITDMMMEFPAGAEDMTNAAYEIFSSMNLMHDGVMNVEGGLQLLGLANKAAVAGQVDLAEATNAMIVALNTFGPTGGSVVKTMDTLMNIVRFGKIRLDDLSASMSSFAAVAKASGLTLKSVGGAFSSLTLFMEPGRAAAGLGRLIELFRVPDFREGFERMGVQVMKASGQMRPLLDIFKDLVRIRPDLAASQTAAVDFFIQVTKASGLTKKGIQGTVQARRAFEQLVTHMGAFASIANNVANNKKELDRAFEARKLDPGVQWEIFKNQLRALAIVIGREALPVFLKIGNAIAGAVRWFQGLNDGVRGNLISWLTWAAALSLVAGILLSLTGTLTQVGANLAIMRREAILAGTASQRMLFGLIAVRTVLLGLTLIGLGVLVQQIYGTRDAVIAMAAAWAIWRLKVIQDIAFVVAANRAGAATVAESWRMALAATGWGLFVVAAGMAAIAIMNNWDKVRAYFYAWQDDVGAGFEDLWRKTKASAENNAGYIMIAFGKIRKATTGDDSTLRRGREMVKSSEEAWNATSKFHENYLRHLKEIRRANKKKMGFDFMKDFNNLAKNLTSAQFRKMWKDWSDTIGDNTKNAASKAKAYANAVQQATENMTQSIEQAAKNLAGVYEELRTQNESAMKGLFQGPTMSGIMGGIFGNINDALRQFGVQIPVPFAILKQDLHQSVTYFKRWRRDINKLLKRGMDIEMVQQIQALGPDAGIPIAEGLLAGGKTGWKSLLKEWKAGQKLIDKATNADMKKKLELWNRYGKDAAWATVQGIIDNPRNYKITKMYETYVESTYGSILKKVFQDDVRDYMANWAADAKAAATTAGITAPPRGRGPKTLTAHERAAQLAGLSHSSTESLTRQYWAANRQVQRLRHFVGPLSPVQRRILQANKRRMALIRSEYRHDAAPAVRRQMKQQTGHKFYEIKYEGDKIVIRADGATVASVTRALQKTHFTKKHRHGKGTTARLPGGGPKP
jgi:TP901 family phage tail tape measure protein